MKLFFTISLFLIICCTSFSQTFQLPKEVLEFINQNNIASPQSITKDSTIGNDLMYLVGNKKPVKGKLTEIGTKTISFIDNAGVNYNLSKSEVRFIKTGDGKTLNYNVDEDPEYVSGEAPVEKDSGGMSGWAVVGIVLTVLLVIGIIAQIAK